MKRKAFEEIPGPSTKKGRRYPEPIHERRLFVKATVIWTSLKGEIKTHEGMFLADSGCSGATMNKTVVNRERMTVIKRAEAISISTAVTGRMGTGRAVRNREYQLDETRLDKEQIVNLSITYCKTIVN
jgi:hypothetical protein